MPRRNACLAAVTRDEDAGIRYTVRHGGKHLRVAVTGQPDIWRAPRRARAYVRRRLRQSGKLSGRR